MNMAPGMMSLYNENGELFGIDYEITDEQVEDDQATVTANITYTVEEESQSQEMDIPLEKIEGRWVHLDELSAAPDGCCLCAE